MSEHKNGLVMGIGYRDLTPHQRSAVDACVRSIESDRPVTRLFGYAGTGKTTVARIIAQQTSNFASFCAYTGKAASVLRRKGCQNAQTIHRMIYDPKEKIDKRGRVVLDFELSDRRYMNACDLVVIDEASMVGRKVGEDIMSLGVPVLAIGDPAQLEPYGHEQSFFMKDRKHAEAWMTQIERHSGLIPKVAQDIRLHGVNVLGNYPDVSKRQYDFTRARYFDQVLVGTNRLRHVVNARMREMLSRSPEELIAAGERIICLENNYRLGVLNGQQFEVMSWRDHPHDDRMVRLSLMCECWPMDVDPPGNCEVCGWEANRWVSVWIDGFTLESQDMTQDTWKARQEAMVATYGYAVTVHKAQGSEWDSVLVINESTKFRRSQRHWLYTAVTRAQTELVVTSQQIATRAERERRTRRTART